MVSHCFLVALRLRSPTCGGTRWYSAACRSPSETRWRFGAGSIRWRCAVALGCPRCTQWHSVGQGGSPCTRRHAHSVFSGALALGGTRPFLVLRAGGRARAQWCLCRSAASGARRHSVALNGARARGGTNRGTRRRFAAHGGARRPRWNAVACGRWHRAVTPLGGARRRFAAHGGAQRRSAALCSARWRSAARGGTRWQAAGGIAQ